MSPDGKSMESMTFATALSRLKQRGSALLVVGNVPPEIHQLACRQLAGDPSIHRQRLFVVSKDSDTDVQMTITEGKRHTNRVIEYATGIRSTCQTESQAAASHEVVTSLTTLMTELVRTIQTIERNAGPLSPGELRVCIDSLTSLVESNDRETAFRFLRYAAIATRRQNGMVHAHLPVARETELTYLFEPLVDAVVELRITNEVPQQRWHLSEPDISSEWIDI